MHELKEEPSNFIRQIIDEDLASGKHTLIHTRFPPEPNGYLHLGHAKSICLNFSLAKIYQGQCNLRLDDTDPIKEEVEYIEAIQQDIRWLGYVWDGAIRYASDYFPQLYQFAVELIQKGLAYVDQLSAEAIRTYRGTLSEAGQNSPYRDRPIHESLALFEQMRLGHLAEGTACLRARIDMASPFMVLRDPVLYRIKWVAHHQTGTHWCIYPMYDFAHPICDALENITHSLCTLEFQDNRRLYDWVLEHISIAHRPHQYEFSRLNVEYTLLSKRKLDQLVTEKIVSGWDDPRMPTLAGLRRRGYTPAAVREFCRRIGITKQDHQIEMSLLESCIRDDLNPNAPRAMAVLNPLTLIIENFPADHPILLSLPNHPDKPELGYRQVPFGREIQIDQADFREQADKHYKRLVLGKSVRLRHAYVITAQRVERDIQGQIVAVYCRYDSETLGRNPTAGKVQGVIHWVAAATALPAEFRLYDRLFKVPNPGVVEDFLAVVNPDSLIVRHGVVEPALQQAHPGDHYQFEREGYFCLDSYSANTDRLVFNRTVALSDRWSNKKR